MRVLRAVLVAHCRYDTSAHQGVLSLWASAVSCLLSLSTRSMIKGVSYQQLPQELEEVDAVRMTSIAAVINDWIVSEEAQEIAHSSA